MNDKGTATFSIYRAADGMVKVYVRSFGPALVNTKDTPCETVYVSGKRSGGHKVVRLLGSPSRVSLSRADGNGVNADGVAFAAVIEDTIATGRYFSGTTEKSFAPGTIPEVDAVIDAAFSIKKKAEAGVGDASDSIDDPSCAGTGTGANSAWDRPEGSQSAYDRLREFNAGRK